MKVTLDRFETDHAVLELPDGSSLSVPRTELPTDAKEGDVLELVFTKNPAATTHQRTQARDIINEILNDTAHPPATNT